MKRVDLRPRSAVLAVVFLLGACNQGAGVGGQPLPGSTPSPTPLPSASPLPTATPTPSPEPSPTSSPAATPPVADDLAEARAAFEQLQAMEQGCCEQQ
ncbi:hypothetical protein AAG565_13860 [Fontimonas sp. SYSU GA230001]|uniref:hypothetical protein n=1 Tax=Fontimonas sp. SYSU GA230001 TaxID=3142450 RepID=UPI0032B4D442